MEINRKTAILISAVLALLILFGVWAGYTHMGRAATNLYMGSLQKVDDSTSYETRKKVEDTCRAMIASYQSDKLVYEQYKDSDSAEKQNWAEQAKMRANKTASTYNNYILENSYVWSGNVPKDIDDKMYYLE